MNKRILYILRHAEAASGNDDRNRPLTDSGRHAATALGLLMRRKGIAPAFILCSPVRRTRETMERLDLENEGAIFYPPSLYNAPASELYERIKIVSASSETVLIVGHNPGVSDLVRFLTGKAMCFAPGALATIECAADSWENIMPAENQLIDVTTL